jgi:hypothetical protein
VATKIELAAIRDALTGKPLVGFEGNGDAPAIAAKQDRTARSRPAKAGAVKVGKSQVGKTTG